MDCPSCGGSFEFPSDAAGQDAPCPHCSQKILLWSADVKAPVMPPLIPPAIPPNPEVLVQPIQKKGELVGAGCFVEGIGIVLMVCGFWFIPLILIGLGLIIWGGRMAIKFICPSCKNRLPDRDVTMCPVCRCRLRK